ncbi:MAG: type III polyketide synthase [Anaerolineae bacterium]|nr:type III polyketide synthase [Anaerolineae bacterium]
MSASRIISIETGVPAHQYGQPEVLDYFLALQGESRRERAVRAIFEKAGVGMRHMAVERDYFNQPRSTQARNDLYMAEAVPLGQAVISAGLAHSGFKSADIDDLIVVSCTGFSIPGLDLQLAGALKMRPDLHRACILGMGCYGAFPGMRRASEAVKANPGSLAMMLSIELCSLHMQFDQSSENVVSTALFSDGAAMVLIGDEAAASRVQGTLGPRIIDARTHCDYSTLDQMSFTVTDTGFRMYLSSYVPDLLAAQVGGFVDGLLAANGLQRADVRHWGIHPGSSKIVDLVQTQLGLADQQVEASHNVLYNYGNMSSATILFVLDTIQRCDHPEVDDYGVLLAFGPGLTMEGMLVQW